MNASRITPFAAAGPQPLAPRARGLTLIELMITMAISLVILGAISYVYLGARGAYRTNDSAARVQETGRFALDAMVRDLRRTGFLGCASSGTATGVPLSVYTVSNGLPSVDFAAGTGVVVGYGGGNTWTPPAAAANYVAGTDALTVRVATSAPSPITANPDPVAGTVTVDGGACTWLKPGNYLMVSSCTRAALVQATTTAPACPGGGGAASTPVAVSYAADATGTFSFGPAGTRGLTLDAYVNAQQFDEVTYYVGTNAYGGTSLYRYSASSGLADEIVDNVQDMYLKFGVGNALGEVAGAYTAASAMAATDWKNVVSVAVDLLVVGGAGGAANGAVSAPQTYKFRGAATTAPDTRLRDVFSVTVALRNRMS